MSKLYRIAQRLYNHDKDATYLRLCWGKQDFHSSHTGVCTVHLPAVQYLQRVPSIVTINQDNSHSQPHADKDERASCHEGNAHSSSTAGTSVARSWHTFLITRLLIPTRRCSAPRSAANDVVLVNGVGVILGCNEGQSAM